MAPTVQIIALVAVGNLGKYVCEALIADCLLYTSDAACLQSKSCKRFIPSEWAGNVDDYPKLPKFYAESRDPFRRILQETVGIEWTLFNCGWLMDYLLPQHLTRMPAEPDTFPINLDAWRACIRGSGDEPQSWTWTKDVATAVGELLAAPSWVCSNFVHANE